MLSIRIDARNLRIPQTNVAQHERAGALQGPAMVEQPETCMGPRWKYVQFAHVGSITSFASTYYTVRMQLFLRHACWRVTPVFRYLLLEVFFTPLDLSCSMFVGRYLLPE